MKNSSQIAGDMIVKAAKDTARFTTKEIDAVGQKVAAMAGHAMEGLHHGREQLGQVVEKTRHLAHDVDDSAHRNVYPLLLVGLILGVAIGYGLSFGRPRES